MRHAIYQGSRPGIRREAHRALVAAVDDRDEDVASLLEQTAARYRLRGATMTAARALRLAAELSPAQLDASQRLADAARASFDAGSVTCAEDLLRGAERLTPGAHIVRRSHGLRGVLEFARGTPERAHHYLTADMAGVSDLRTALGVGHHGHARRVAGGPRGPTDQGARPAVRTRHHRSCPPKVLALWSDDPTQDAVDDAGERAGAALLRLLPPAPLALAWGIDTPMSDALHRRTPQLRHRAGRARLAVD